MKKYSAELISFGLLVCGIGLSWGISLGFRRKSCDLYGIWSLLFR